MNSFSLKNIEYLDLPDLKSEELLHIFKKSKVREHLVAHKEFDETSLGTWIEEKIKVNAESGCRVKGIEMDGNVAGWCGIQQDGDRYELAVVLDTQFWGIGVAVFKELMGWAAELGHEKVVLHLFNTRREYRFLKKLASRVYKSKIFGESYTSYELVVPSA
jgi:GNAT superfamily N-acetyltransferase